jgi:mono/diheme cytochrome c family protein
MAINFLKRFSGGMLLAALSLPVLAGSEDILSGQCASCHNLTGPAPATVEALVARKGPDLFYAGNKYKAAWMERWLQKPQRIRPAGVYYPDHVKSGPKGDEIDVASLPAHPALNAADAKAVTAALMTRKANSELIKASAYKPGTIARNMGEMMFDKFKGCLSCHEIESGYGGASGPEVYTAGLRLQEDYLVSYLANPQAWDPKIYMPNKHLSETDVQKFVHYFRLLGEEAAQ